MRIDVSYPSGVEVELAKTALTHLRQVLAATTGGDIQVQIQAGGMTETVSLPQTAVEVLGNALSAMARGRGVALIDPAAELTTQQAADLLQVSRPYVIKLINTGELDYRLVGKHRRILASSLLSYKQADLAKRHAALDELTALSQEMGLY